jgi:hypothetical protein
MRSYIKIYGPPVLKAIKELEKLAIDMPQVCIMDTIIAAVPIPMGSDDTYSYFTGLGGGEAVTMERCDKIISKSGEMLGDHDFFFEWFRDPTQAEINDLIGKIDEALAPLGCKYTITTRHR